MAVHSEQLSQVWKQGRAQLRARLPALVPTTSLLRWSDPASFRDALVRGTCLSQAVPDRDPRPRM